jgi:hypothetical protein
VEGQQLKERVRELRGRGCTPKQIARILGVPPATVAPLLRAVAAEGQAGEKHAGARESAATEFWVSPGWSRGLAVGGGRQWPDAPADDGTSGMVTVAAAREHGGSKVSFCGYLLDVYCLGVKNALGPRRLDRRKLPALLGEFFSAYDAPPLAAPAELARNLVFGAVEYARALGFGPHPDFEACAGHLGPWVGPSVIRFGCDGKPLFIQGPHDDSGPIIRTLEHSVGQGNFDFMIVA